MPALLKCENCQGKVSSEAAKKMDGKVVCPRCVSALRKASEIRKLAEKKVKEQRAKAAASERAMAAAPAAGSSPAAAAAPAKSGSSPRLAGSVRSSAKSSSRVRAARAAELLGGDPEAAALVRSGRFIALFVKLHAAVCFLGAALSLAGGSAGAVLAGRAEGASTLTMAAGLAGALVSAALLALAGIVFWRAANWVKGASALLARLTDAGESREFEPAAAPASRPRIIMPEVAQGN